MEEEVGRTGKVFETRNSLMARAHLFMQGSGGQFQQHVYKQFLRSQIPKAQKDSQVKQPIVLSGPACVKAVHKHVDEIDPLVVVVRHLWLKKNTRDIMREKSRDMEFEKQKNHLLQACRKVQINKAKCFFKLEP